MNSISPVILPTVEEMGKAAADYGASILREMLLTKERVNLVVATGASQFTVLSHLISQPDIDWSRVHGFHLDEYVGLSDNHPASFCRYLRKRFVEQVPLASFEYIRGDCLNPDDECSRLADLLEGCILDLAFVGIGENGHLAFNDPPADFENENSYLVVELDEACRRQQMGEGWFEILEEVPIQAISMSIRQIMKIENIVCSVPDLRKAEAVESALEGPVTPDLPASILQHHQKVKVFLDQKAASGLSL
ncbi:MAG: glucosamine-6-phosphate deaminase [Verrucomicrobiota bacterium]|nr:glucosamine-6-phosphate deaminase [Verrucomicrobiota bacterium]